MVVRFGHGCSNFLQQIVVCSSFSHCSFCLSLQRSIRAFAECPLVSEIVLVAGKNREFLEQQAAACTKPVQVVQGGATRAESAKNGVLAAHGELVAVHDAARPNNDYCDLLN